MLEGGLLFGVLDVEQQIWVGTSAHSYLQDFDDALMALEFTLEETTDVQVLLVNWAATDTSSRWLIREVSVARTEADASGTP